MDLRTHWQQEARRIDTRHHVLASLILSAEARQSARRESPRAAALFRLYCAASWQRPAERRAA